MRQQTRLFITGGLMAMLLLAACSGPQIGGESSAEAQVDTTIAAVETPTIDTAAENNTAVVQALSDPTSESSDTEVETASEAAPESEEEAARPDGWTEATHSNDVDPDYDVVFPQDAVNTITITISPENWAAMQSDLTDLLGEPGTEGRGKFNSGDGPPEGSAPPADGQPPAGGSPPAGGFGAGGMGQRDPDMVGGTPIWVDATLEMDGVTWNHVGIRYKGNSSLSSGWREGSLKLPFKLDFDEFEDDFPAIDNQRFFGFKQLSLANGFSDDSNMRETVAYDLFQDSGLIASETAFYEIVLDYGEGPVNLGIYTAVEVIDDTVITNALGDNDGNIYEADGTAASLADGVFDQIADTFEKENNDDEPDWSDVEALYTALHADTRTTDPEQWRADLEAVFDVDTFLNWLAISAVMGNWDTYGAMSHNYYLYSDPETGQLVWIPWDHNMILGSAAISTGGNELTATGGRQRGPRGTVTLDKADIGDNWPLVRFLLDDPVYSQIYEHHLANASELFDAGTLTAKYEEWRELLLPTITAAGVETDFNTAVDRLIQVTTDRDTAVGEYVDSQ